MSLLLDGPLQKYSNLEMFLHKDEETLLKEFLRELSFLEDLQPQIQERGAKWILGMREMPQKTFDIQRFLQAFPLTHAEGRSLMELAEAYLRIPDSTTANLLLKDKISNRSWKQLDKNEKNIIGLSRWGLNFLSRLQNQPWGKVLQPITLQGFKIFMRLLSREFIIGRTIEEALKRRQKNLQDRFSFDMLGEGARTFSMAKSYKDAYIHAIQTLGQKQNGQKSLLEKDSISVKLSALHPFYKFSHHQEVMKDLLPDLVELCVLAKNAGIALTIDAEEASRLELSLDLMEKVCQTKELKGWDGFGFALQAYQKRAPAVIDWAKGISKKNKLPLMVRLVKGAYWDTEIKISQVEGHATYPVFTRKPATDLSYLACAHELLKAQGLLYPQFATHNAFTVSALLEMTKGRNDIEFQRLQGMGEDLYALVKKDEAVPCRIYAPVGNDRDLLPYLVRRLLENGANSSFVHKTYDSSLSIEKALGNPWSFFDSHTPGAHPQIPLPKDIYGPTRMNSQGFDLSNRATIESLKDEIEKASLSYGSVKEATLQDLEQSVSRASSNWESWNATSAQDRASILKKAADLIEARQGLFLGLLIKEGKKTLPDAIAELREATDFCRYYAEESLKHFAQAEHLCGPTGEKNELILKGRGVFACISPWNFPLAIFTGQVTAALAAGNAVIAKPASQTPLIAKHMIQTLYDAGVPSEILHFLPGRSNIIGSPLIEDLRINGVVFTGSTSTAQSIQKALIDRGGPLVHFIAETGGLNAMIVDSSALIEQVVDDAITSAFQSAGQRCSALRILFIQEDIYTPTLTMLREAMEALTVDDPQWLSTDVGPVINATARDEIEAYIAQHNPLARTPLSPQLKDTFVAPTLIEVRSMEDVTKEVFGPVLHVARFKAKNIEDVVRSINQSGYGLTMGLQSRIGITMKKVRDLARVGNLYVNRNMIGAVVGVQPFGGEGLSGTGPKAGGPYYLPRFAVEQTTSINIMASGGNIDLLNLEE